MKIIGILGVMISWCCVAFVAAGEAGYKDWAACVLDRMPGVASDDEAERIDETCKSRYPEPKKKKSRCGVYDIKDCVEAHLAGAEAPKAIGSLQDACGRYFSPEMKPRESS